MKTDYEKIIDFCEAEFDTDAKTKYWVFVQDRGSVYTIVFIVLSHSVDILKPEFVEIRDAQDLRLFGELATPYKEDYKWSHIAHMLGLKSAWIACVDRLPESGKDYWVMLPDGHMQQARLTNDLRWRTSHKIKDGHFIVSDCFPTHWQPLPAKP